MEIFQNQGVYNQAIVKKTKYFHLSNQNTGKPLDLFQSSLQQERMARDFEIWMWFVWKASQTEKIQSKSCFPLPFPSIFNEKKKTTAILEWSSKHTYAWQMVYVIVKELILGQNDLQTAQFIFLAALSHSLSKGQHKSN